MESPAAPDVTAPRRRRRWPWVLGLLLAVGLVVAVELGSPRHVGPTGVDDLVVPWAAPDPDEFVEGIDHPWLPLRPDARWVHVGEVGGVETTRTTTVLPERREVAGVVATVVREVTVAEGGPETVRERWYAQDRRGHVWTLGEEGLWQVGGDVSAGLAMAAEPRRGDAHVRVPLGGAEREVVEVSERGGALRVPAGAYDDLLRVLERSGEEGGDEAVAEVLLAEGTGVVEWRSSDGRLDLVSHDPGR